MYVCVCKEVTDNQLKAAVESGSDSVRAVSRCLGVGTQCGKCVCYARERIQVHQRHIDTEKEQAA